MAIDDRRVIEIVRTHTSIPKSRLPNMKDYDLWLTAQEAVDYGVADEIGDFSPPRGAVLFNL